MSQAREQKQTEFERDAHKVLSKIYSGANNYKKAYIHQADFKQLSDSLINIESVALVKDIETKYETQQKENKILKLENEGQQKEIELQKSNFKTNLSLIVLALVLVIGGIWIQKRKKQQQLNLLQTSIKSTEEEKIRIGMELHDGVASNLVKLAHDTETKNVELSHKLLDTYNEIRELSHKLNNTAVKGELFFDRLFDLMPENKENKVFNLKVSPISLSIKEPFSTHIFRITQELLANNLKYSNASKTDLIIDLNKNNLSLKYKDNGVGVESIIKGNGTKNIENRVTLMNGDLKINSKKDENYTVLINIPYNQ